MIINIIFSDHVQYSFCLFLYYYYDPYCHNLFLKDYFCNVTIYYICSCDGAYHFFGGGEVAWDIFIISAKKLLFLPPHTLVSLARSTCMLL